MGLSGLLHCGSCVGAQSAMAWLSPRRCRHRRRPPATRRITRPRRSRRREDNATAGRLRRPCLVFQLLPLVALAGPSCRFLRSTGVCQFRSSVCWWVLGPGAPSRHTGRGVVRETGRGAVIAPAGDGRGRCHPRLLRAELSTPLLPCPHRVCSAQWLHGHGAGRRVRGLVPEASHGAVRDHAAGIPGCRRSWRPLASVGGPGMPSRWESSCSMAALLTALFR